MFSLITDVPVKVLGSASLWGVGSLISPVFTSSGLGTSFLGILALGASALGANMFCGGTLECTGSAPNVGAKASAARAPPAKAGTMKRLKVL